MQKAELQQLCGKPQLRETLYVSRGCGGEVMFSAKLREPLKR